MKFGLKLEVSVPRLTESIDFRCHLESIRSPSSLDRFWFFSVFLLNHALKFRICWCGSLKIHIRSFRIWDNRWYFRNPQNPIRRGTCELPPPRQNYQPTLAPPAHAPSRARDYGTPSATAVEIPPDRSTWFRVTSTGVGVRSKAVRGLNNLWQVSQHQSNLLRVLPVRSKTGNYNRPQSLFCSRTYPIGGWFRVGPKCYLKNLRSIECEFNLSKLKFTVHGRSGETMSCRVSIVCHVEIINTQVSQNCKLWTFRNDSITLIICSSLGVYVAVIQLYLSYTMPDDHDKSQIYYLVKIVILDVMVSYEIMQVGLKTHLTCSPFGVNQDRVEMWSQNFGLSQIS